MCGIIGYVGTQECGEIILEGLSKLEYRGYDSAGIAVIGGDGETRIRRTAGKLVNLERSIRKEPLQGMVGIGHTRWATHGRPTEENAHPHQAGDVVVVHNGIIENHLQLKRELAAKGSVFKSETDTEIISHLIEEELKKEPGLALEQGVRRALLRVRGAYAIAVLDRSQPDRVVAAKNASPLVAGLGDGENFVASDIPAILSHTRRVIFLDEGEMVVITRESVRISRVADGMPLDKKVTQVNWSPAMAEKGGYKHFMLKEIHEQPRALVDTIRGRASIEQGDVFFDDLALDDDAIKALRRIVIVACGTSWHAGLIGRYLIEDLARIPVEVDLGSEFRYRKPVIEKDSLYISISQSGETADTLAAIKLVRAEGAQVLSVCNVVDASIPRESDHVIYTHAGPEIGVASTKAFTTQLVVLYLLAIRLGRARGKLEAARASELLQDLIGLPALMEDHLKDPEPYLEIARKYRSARDVLYLGRGLQFPIALEGALKLKEISYIHAEGYAAGEMKHGPIALIDEAVPTVILLPRNSQYDKAASNLAEIRARSGRIIAIASEGDSEVQELADDVIYVPRTSEQLEPIMTSLPMQLLAYHMADLKGTDVDQPRNLAKSVTVE